MTGHARARTIVAVHPGAELYGSDRVFLDTVRGLAQVADRVVVAVPHEGPLVTQLTTMAPEVEVVILPMLVLRKALMKPAGWWRLMRDSFSGLGPMWRLLRRERPDLVFVNTVTLPLWVWVGRITGHPVVLHVHEGEQSAGAAVRRLLYLPALAATRILVNSAFSRDVMTSTYRRLAERSEIIPNAVPGPATVTPARASLSDGLHVAYIGRLSPRKGPDLVIEAARRSNGHGPIARVDIVGSAFTGYEWFDEQLRTLATDHGLAGVVRFHGFQEDVWDVLAQADVLVVPSRFDEPFGNTAVEGVLAGRPVVVSATSGLIEATAGLSTAVRVRPDSAEAIAAGLQQVFEEWPDLRARLDDARMLAEGRHDPAAYRDRVAAGVRSALG